MSQAPEIQREREEGSTPLEYQPSKQLRIGLLHHVSMLVADMSMGPVCLCQSHLLEFGSVRHIREGYKPTISVHQFLPPQQSLS